ncbi:MULTISPECIES: MFS transporter [unclassified Pseudoclavibacter]|uniref:MFS transporter n=1 Tax=unclassified Pseudoclavibacter TaxID=2615177 RepID=UPI0013013762|nr:MULTISPECIES: MFS transporter [unclassified Pseudoclavibacter]KAB1647255.1 MFS transporter [Pseudoclavibacter sp. CFCC 14310]KAB1662752.1 MFS transporter [Pseudoclavibacter sp. CFCC 13611]
MISTFRSLAVRNYRCWFAGALVSNVGMWMQRTAQDWIVLTQLTDHDAAAVGVITALQFGPQLLLTPLAGMVCDRFQRRRVLLVTQIVMGLLGFALGAWVLLGSPDLLHIYAFALALGVVSAFDTPARQVFVSDLVPRGAVGNAVALNSTSFNLSRMAGPAVAGVLIAIVGAGWVFVINGFTFVGVIAALLLIRPRDYYGEPVATTPKTARTSGILEGIRYVRGRSDLQLVMLMIFLIGTFGMNFPVLLSAMVTVTYQQGAQEYGVISSVLGIGSLVGALISASLERPRLRSVMLGAVGFGFVMLGAAFAPTLLTFAIALVALGLCTQTILASANGYVQLTSAPTVRGRVMALYMALLMGGTPFGAPLVGWVANTFGPRWSLVVAAASGLVAAGAAAWWLFLTHHGRLHRNPDGGLRHAFVIELDGGEARTPADVDLAAASKPRAGHAGAGGDSDRQPVTQPVSTVTTEIAVIDVDRLGRRRRVQRRQRPPHTLER